MTWLRRVTSLFLIVFAILVMIASRRLGIGSLQDPGSGFMGFFASALLLLLSTVILLRDELGSEIDRLKLPSFSQEIIKKPAILTASLVIYVILLPLLGYLLASSILIFSMLATYHRAKWYFHLVVALAMVNVSYLVFDKWLGVVLPPGTLGMAW